MSPVLPTMARACGRTSVRVALSGALAIGLLTSAPTSEAHAASTVHASSKPHHHKPRHHKPKVTPVERALRTAVAQKGDPYAYGAAGPNRFDCSGLTYYSFRRAGFHHIPRTS